MQRFYKFIVVFLLLTTNWLAATAQRDASGSINSTATLNGKKIKPSTLSESQLRFKRPISQFDPATHKRTSTYSKPPSNYYLKMLGIVCKAEYAVEKKLKLPLALRVRAGSLDYVNKMEGKK